MNPRQVLVRSGALLGALALGPVASIGWPAPEANIGLGLLTFAATSLVAGLWGARDGRRESYTVLAPAWLLVAIGVGVTGAAAVSVGGWLAGGGFFPTVLLADLLILGPLGIALVAVPALLGLALGQARPVERRT